MLHESCQVRVTWVCWVRRVRGVRVLAVFVMLGGGTAFAQSPTVKPARVTAPPTIDGRLDDPSWTNAARITEFVQRRPLDGAPATERTEVYIAYDSERLYFGINAHYSESSLVRANRVDRDQIWNDDRVSVIFDPFRDQQRGYRFAINAYGVQGDAMVASGGTGAAAAASAAGPGDLSWNVLFASAGELTSDGWTAEFAVPFKSLRYPARGAGEAHRWGLQIERDIESKDENVVWAPISRDVMSELGQMGSLDGNERRSGRESPTNADIYFTRMSSLSNRRPHLT